MLALTYLLLGSNLGDRAAYLAAARQGLAATAGRLVAASGIYETAAWGLESQPDFLNQVLALETTLTPLALLTACQAVEQAGDRQRGARWGPRTLDVDVLFFGAEIIESPTLRVPHPALPYRRFTLTPLAELAPTLRHPVLHQTIAELLAACPDEQPVWQWG